MWQKGTVRKKRLKGVKKHRRVGHKPKKNKKSVAERKRLKKLEQKNAIKEAIEENKNET